MRLTSGKDEIVLVTAKGRALRYSESEIRPMGRQAAGVSGIKLAKDDHLASIEVVTPNGYLMVVTEKGFGKRTPLSEYSATSRTSRGVSTIDLKNLAKVGDIATAPWSKTMTKSSYSPKAGSPCALRPARSASAGTPLRGGRLMGLGAEDHVASLACLPAEEPKPTEPTTK